MENLDLRSHGIDRHLLSWSVGQFVFDRSKDLPGLVIRL